MLWRGAPPGAVLPPPVPAAAGSPGVRWGAEPHPANASTTRKKKHRLVTFMHGSSVIRRPGAATIVPGMLKGPEETLRDRYEQAHRGKGCRCHRPDGHELSAAIRRPGS